MLQHWKHSIHCITGKASAFPEDYFPARAKPGCSLQAKRSGACIIKKTCGRVLSPYHSLKMYSYKPITIAHTAFPPWFVSPQTTIKQNSRALKNS
jgi:hypothetical protein